MRRLCDVRPGAAPANSRRMVARNTESRSNDRIGFAFVSKPANLPNVMLGQSGPRAILTPRNGNRTHTAIHGSGRPSLRNHVPYVVPAGSEKQMERINARRIVARMAHEDAGWDLPIVQFPGKAVNVNRLVVHPDHPMAKRGGCPSPHPAVIRPSDGDFGPEQRFRGWPNRQSGRVTGAKSARHSPLGSVGCVVSIRDLCSLTAPTATEPVSVGPVFGNSGVNGTITVMHRNLHSGEPVGVTSTATGNFVALNYSASSMKLVAA